VLRLRHCEKRHEHHSPVETAAPKLPSKRHQVRRPRVSPTPPTEINFRFSGHQTFPLRIAWIPKAVGEIVRGRDPLSDVDEGITK
jgi:hypothetical protein